MDISSFFQSRQTLVTVRLFSICFAVSACSPGGEVSGVQGAIEDRQEPGDRTISVEIAPVAQKDIQETLDLTGIAQVWDEFTVSSEIAGKVAAIEVQEGDWVKSGQLLLQMDSERRTLELKTRQARLAQVQLELAYAQRQSQRGQTLAAKKVISDADLDQLDQQVRLLEAAVQVAELDVESIQQELEDGLIRAPAFGQVLRRFVSLGESINASEDLFKIVQFDPIKVGTEIGEWDLFKIQTGQSVEVFFDAIPGQSFRGKIKRIETVANPNSGAFPLEIQIPNPRLHLQAGMVARIRMAGELFEKATTIPIDAVLDIEGVHYVFVAREGVVQRRKIQIVKRFLELVIVEDPIPVGTSVVVRGQSNLTDGTPVRIAPGS